MLTEVEPTAPKTRGYLKYLLKTIIEHAPLREREIIQVKITEDSPVLPKITEISESFPDGKFISKELSDDEDRTGAKMLAIASYTRKQLNGMCAVLVPEFYPVNPFTIIFSFVIVNPQKIYQEAQELGIELPSILDANKKGIDAYATFNEDPPRILWENKTINIPSSTIQHYVCRIAWEKKMGEEISWDEVAQEVDGLSKKDIKTGRQAIYDAVKRINKKTIEKAKKPLFQWTDKAFIRIA